MKTIKTIALIISVIVAASIVVRGIDSLLKMPEVRIDYKTRKCIEVMNFDPDRFYNCDNYEDAGRYTVIYDFSSYTKS